MDVQMADKKYKNDKTEQENKNGQFVTLCYKNDVIKTKVSSFDKIIIKEVVEFLFKNGQKKEGILKRAFNLIECSSCSILDRIKDSMKDGVPVSNRCSTGLETSLDSMRDSKIKPHLSKINNHSLSDEQKKNHASLSDEQKKNNTTVSVEQRKNIISLSLKPYKNNISLSDKQEKNNTSLFVEQKKNNTSLSDKQEKNNTSLSVEQKNNNTSVADEQKRKFDCISTDNFTNIKMNTKIKIKSKYPPPFPAVPAFKNNILTCKKLPSAPILTVEKENNTIDFTWNMKMMYQTEEIHFYEFYYCKETKLYPNTSMWKKIGDIQAANLPMFCKIDSLALTEGSTYYFIIRAVDIHGRRGPFAHEKLSF